MDHSGRKPAGQERELHLVEQVECGVAALDGPPAALLDAFDPLQRDQRIDPADRANRTRARRRPGYQSAEVDEFIARIEATLAGDARSGQVVTAAGVEAVKFGTTLRGGYDEQVVDEALDQYAEALARLAPFPGPP